MSRTITALFDTRADAEAGAERLRQAGVDASHLAVHDNGAHQTAPGVSNTGDKAGSGFAADPAASHASRHADKGMWATIKNAFLPTQDRRAYEEGVRRGGFLLTADVSDDAMPAAVRALEEANSVDLDARSEEWRSDGWVHDDADADGEMLDEGVYRGTRDTEFDGPRYRAYHRDES